MVRASSDATSPEKSALPADSALARSVAPWNSSVISFARTRWPSRSCGRSAAERSSSATRSCGRKVNHFRNRTTSASAVFSQYWWKRNGLVRSAVSQTAPFSLLPNLVPSDLVTSGLVIPYASPCAMRRTRSMPLTMLPHWSAPPSCTVHPAVRKRCRKS